MINLLNQYFVSKDFTFLVEFIFWISEGCCPILAKGTSTEYLILWSNCITIPETILNEGFRFPPGNTAFRTCRVLNNDGFLSRWGGIMKKVWMPKAAMYSLRIWPLPGSTSYWPVLLALRWSNVVCVICTRLKIRKNSKVLKKEKSLKVCKILTQVRPRPPFCWPKSRRWTRRHTATYAIPVHRRGLCLNEYQLSYSVLHPWTRPPS